jgi:hypothetical protein
VELCFCSFSTQPECASGKAQPPVGNTMVKSSWDWRSASQVSIGRNREGGRGGQAWSTSDKGCGGHRFLGERVVGYPYFELGERKI